MTMDRHQRDALDRHLTTDPENQPDQPDEIEPTDVPDACSRCDWLGAHDPECPMHPVELSPERRHALLWMWALYQVETHTPVEYSNGYTCDEMGCLICNAGDEAIAGMVEAMTTGIDQGPDQPRWHLDTPDDRELLDALVELAEQWKP